MNDKNIRLITMIGIWVAVVLFLLAIIVLSKNIEEIKTDPIIYGMEKHNFDACTCYMEDGSYTNIVFDDFKINQEGSG